MSVVENSPTEGRASARRPPVLRSRVTNGKRLFVEADGRGPWARRWRDVLAEITADLGGHDLLSEGQRQLIRRAATIAVVCEKMEGEAAAGAEIDLDVYGTLTDRLGRCFHRLGLKRQSREVDSLASYLEQLQRERGEGLDQEGAVEAEDGEGAAP
jgi:hypothetical protein